MFDWFNIGFLRLAFIGALLSAISTSLLSVFISLKKISYMSEALSHISFTGIAIALFFGWSVSWVSGIFILIMVWVIQYLSKKYKFEETNITFIILSVSMALGVIILSLKKSYTMDLASYMFGNILLVNKLDLYMFLSLIVFNILFLYAFYREILYMTYNYEIANFYHVPVDKIYLWFLVLLALNIIISVKIIGIILITAQLVLPGMTALNFTKKIPKATFISVIIALISSFIGFLGSYYYNFPSGAVIVMILFCFFIASLIINKTKGCSI
ncbi:MAG: metal ABC transporter permease [Bacilli bacterium]|jgi:zinc transport system permease protein|nr:metal ABC transporter permease [Candidatus Cloacimonadota bacterium]MDD2493339.1 metal ABC transporter permease [Bacilli bacterium]MDD4155428.1 metal ABC transporter permease [Candidatus Cloacimonadota bacterium]